MNAADIIALLGIAKDLFDRINKIAKQTEENAPEVWAEVADHYNQAAAAFKEKA